MVWASLSDENKCTLLSYINKYDSLPEKEFVIKNWTTLANSGSDIKLAFDTVNQLKGAFYFSEGSEFNLLIGDVDFNWSEALDSILDKKISFVTTSEISEKLNPQYNLSQLGFAGTTDLDLKMKSDISLDFKPLQEAHIDDLIYFIKLNYPKRYLDLYYKDDNFLPLLQYAKEVEKWAYLAFIEGEIMGYVSYFKSKIPLIGVDCAFVADLVIHRDIRGKGAAVALQSYAYQEFYASGLNWVLGSIFPDNLASIKQAIKLNRSNHINLINFLP